MERELTYEEILEKRAQEGSDVPEGLTTEELTKDRDSLKADKDAYYTIENTSKQSNFYFNLLSILAKVTLIPLIFLIVLPLARPLLGYDRFVSLLLILILTTTACLIFTGTALVKYFYHFYKNE